MGKSPTRTLALVATLAAVLSVGAYYIQADTPHASGGCPLCGAQGVSIPDRDQLTKCECEKWWNGQAPARLMFADCSARQCAEQGPTRIEELQGSEALPRVYVDLQLYRCPNDGLLFTDPE